MDTSGKLCSFTHAIFKSTKLQNLPLTRQRIKFLPLHIRNNFTTGDSFQDRTVTETDKLFNKYLISTGIFLNIKQKDSHTATGKQVW